MKRRKCVGENLALVDRADKVAMVGAKVLLPWQLMVMAITLTMTMALLSGLAALRSLRLVEPAILLR